MIAEQRTGQLRMLTAMRWCAAAIIVLPHVDITQLPPMLRQLFGNGTVGVMFFFMLSGFVLTWSMKPGDTKRRFYQRRFARIYPLHLVTLLLAIPVYYLEGASPTWIALPFSLTLTQSWLPFPNGYNAFNWLSWSLSCEAFFYLVFPFIIPVLILLTARRRRQLLAAIIVLIAAKGVVVYLLAGVNQVIIGGLSGYAIGHWAGYYLPAVRILDFLFGILLALEVRDGARSVLTLRRATFIALAVFVGVAQVPNLDLGTVDALMFVPVALLLFAGATRDLGGAKAPGPLWVVLGQASFAMYMVQQLILRVCIVVAPGIFHLPAFATLAMAAAAIVVLTAISVPVHSWFEKPLERMLRPKLSPTLVNATNPAIG